MAEILKAFRQQVEKGLGEKGVNPLPMLFERDGEVHVVVMSTLDPAEAAKFATDLLLFNGADKVVWGLDRINKNPAICDIEEPYFLTVFYFCDGWKYGVMPYEHDPETVHEIDWDNAFWQAASRTELIQFFEAVFHLKVTK